MTYNGGYLCVGSFLTNVHARLVAKMKIQQNTGYGITEAKQLEDYLNKIKDAVKDLKVESSISKISFDELLDQHALAVELKAIQDALQRINPQANLKLQDLFMKQGGLLFEQQFAAVINGIVDANTDNAIQKAQTDQEVLYGQKKFSLDLDIAGMAKSLGEQWVKTTSEALKQNLEKQARRFGPLSKKGVVSTTANKDVKIDVDASQAFINVTFSAQSQTNPILNLLKDASFSLKNYDPKSKLMEVTKGNISLGSTKIGTAIPTALMGLGYSPSISYQAYTAAMLAMDGVVTKDKPHNWSAHAAIGSHLAHLRGYYELMGQGQKANGIEPAAIAARIFDGAKYLVWNDPGGRIVVKSTAALVSQYLASNEAMNEIAKVGYDFDSGIITQYIPDYSLFKT